MRAAAERDGVQLLVVSAFRSVDQQRSVIARKLENGRSIGDILKANATPGHSEHHTGRALRNLTTPGCPPLEQVFESTGAFAWLERRATQHRFRLSYQRDNPNGIGMSRGTGRSPADESHRLLSIGSTPAVGVRECDG